MLLILCELSVFTCKTKNLRADLNIGIKTNLYIEY